MIAAIAPALISGATSLIGGQMAQNANAKASRLQMIAQAQAAAEQKAYNERAIAGLEQARQEALGYSDKAIKTYDDSAAYQTDAINQGTAARVGAINYAYDETGRIIDTATGQQVTAIDQGNAEQVAALNRLRTENQGGMQYLRSVLADPESLTPDQRAQLQDMRRNVGNTIVASGFGNSGRSAAALFKKTETDFTNDVMARNRAAALSAAGLMASTDNNAGMQAANAAAERGQQMAAIYAGAGGAKANLASNRGSMLSSVYGDQAQQVAGIANTQAGRVGAAQTGQGAITTNTAANVGSIISGTGKSQADAAVKSGEAQASATTANGKISGQTFGEIGGLVAGAIKDYNLGQKKEAIDTQVQGARDSKYS
jgi:hypothetical protein